MDFKKIGSLTHVRTEKPATIYLVRHGHSTANAKSILAGRDFKVRLSKSGEIQAQALAEKLAQVDFVDYYSSPLPRCLETLQPLLTRHPGAVVKELTGVIEMEYGEWSGKRLATLSRNKLWRTIQERPSLVRFPSGESFVEMQNRALESVKKVAIPGKNILVCSHGDVIKAIVSGFLGLHLDQFQRITIDPASITKIVLMGDTTRLLSLNESATDLAMQSMKRKDDRLNLGGGSGR